MKIFKQARMTFFYPAITVLAFPLLCFSAPEWTNVKTVGGHILECSATSPPVSDVLQPLNMKLISVANQGRSTLADFEIQFVRCKKNEWSVEKSVTNDFGDDFKDEIGQVQSEKISYSNYHVQVKDKDTKILQTIPFLASNLKSNLKFKIKINKQDLAKDMVTKSKYVDVMLIADRVRQTSSDRFFDEVNWGAYRLTIQPSR